MEKNKEKWVLTFDRDEGALFYAPNIIPKGSDLHQITDEYAVYLDKKFNPKGIMIEYYGVNFIKHHPEFEKITEKIFKKDNKEIETIGVREINKKGEALVFKKLLETTLISEAVQDDLLVAV